MAGTSAEYYLSTEEILKKFKPSLSNYFAVTINSANFGGIDEKNINFYAYEAVLPGTSYETTQVFGDIQGLTQTFANKRVYPPVDISFYVDYNYDVLHFFESWISTISSCPDEKGKDNSYIKFNYPDKYKKSEITIAKFEKKFREPLDRLKSAGNLIEPIQAKYTLFNAYPVNLISLPISYENTGLLRTTVTFNYDRYYYEHKDGTKTRRNYK